MPRLTRSPCALATKPAISSDEDVIDGNAPTASSALAVKFCATVLVMQCTRGVIERRRARVSAAICGKSPDREESGACISSPSAGMTRIRFVGLACAASQSGWLPDTPRDC